LDFLAKGYVTTALKSSTRAKSPLNTRGDGANELMDPSFNTLDEIKERVINLGLKGPIVDPTVQPHIRLTTLAFRSAKFLACSEPAICLEGQKVGFSKDLGRLSVSKEALRIEVPTWIDPHFCELVPLTILRLQKAG